MFVCLHDALLHCSVRDEAVEVHRLCLPNTMHARHRLQVDLSWEEEEGGHRPYRDGVHDARHRLEVDLWLPDIVVMMGWLPC